MMAVHRLLFAIFFVGFYCHGFVLHNPVLQQSSLSQRRTTVFLAAENFASFTERLSDCLRRNDTTPIDVEGYVTSKRSFGKLVFVDFQTVGGDLCQAMLRKEYYVGQHYDGYRKCLLKGSKFKLFGVAAPTRNPGNVVLLLQSIDLLALPRQVQHIQIILDLVKKGAVPLEQVARACGRSAELQKQLIPKNDLIEKQWLKELAKDILASLPEDPSYPAAADQKEISKLGNFVIPEAPKDWQVVPALPMLNNKVTVEMKTVEEAPNNPTEQITVSVNGWVQNRRRFQDNITLIQLVDDLTLLSEDTRDVQAVATGRLACLMHPGLLQDAAGVYSNLMAVGANVWLEGQLLPDTILGNSILWVQQIRLVQSSSRSVTIRHLLDLLYENKMEVEEVAEALLMPYQDALLLSRLDATERQWKANELAVSLQASQSRRTIVAPELLKVMEKYQYVSRVHPVIPTSINETQEGPTLMAGGMPGCKWESKKRPQLEWMGQQIRSVLQSHPDFGKRKLSILDIGGGKGSLANYLGRTIDDVRIHVVDICAGAVANGAEKAKKLNAPVEFQVADASADLDIDADVVVALHAVSRFLNF
jgi:hypothetical protein